MDQVVTASTEAVDRDEAEDDRFDENGYWIDPAYCAPPGGDGPYWLFDHGRGSIYPLVHQNGRWHDCLRESMEGKEVVQGPLVLPPQPVLDRQAEHFESMRELMQEQMNGADPLWPVVELSGDPAFEARLTPLKEAPVFPSAVVATRRRRRTAAPEPAPEYVAPYEVIDGFYWIRPYPGAAPVFAQMHEGRWGGMTEDPYMWSHEDLSTFPTILFGPFEKPDRDQIIYRLADKLLN